MQHCRRAQEKFFYAALAIRQAVAEKSERGFKFWTGFHRIVRLRVQSVVNGNALTSAKPFIRRNNRLSAAVSKNQVILRNQTSEGICRIAANTIQRGGCIDIPECDCVAALLQPGHRLFEQLIENSDAAG